MQLWGFGTHMGKAKKGMGISKLMKYDWIPTNKVACFQEKPGNLLL